MSDRENARIRKANSRQKLLAAARGGNSEAIKKLKADRDSTRVRASEAKKRKKKMLMAHRDSSRVKATKANRRKEVFKQEAQRVNNKIKYTGSRRVKRRRNTRNKVSV